MSVRTDSWGGGGGGVSQGDPYGGAQECHLFLAGFLRKENSVILVIEEVELTLSRKDLIEAKRERERQRARINM